MINQHAKYLGQKTVPKLLSQQYDHRMARDGKAIDLRGQGRQQNTTSGSVKPQIVFYRHRVHIYCKLNSILDPYGINGRFGDLGFRPEVNLQNRK